MKSVNDQTAFRRLLEEVQKKYSGFNLTVPSGCKNLKMDLKKDFNLNMKKIQLEVHQKQASHFIDRKFLDYEHTDETITEKAISIHFKKLAKNNLPSRITGKLVNSVEYYAVFLGYMGWRGYCSDPQLSIKEAIWKYPKENIESPSQEFQKVAQTSRHYFESNRSLMQDLSMTVLESISVKKELFKILDDLWDVDNFVDTTIPPNAKDKLLEFYFDSIVKTHKLKGSHLKILNEFTGTLGRNNWEWYNRSVIISALSISFIKHIDETKANFLIQCINDRDKENEKNGLWQKAIVGLILGLVCSYNDNQRDYIIKQLAQNISMTEDIKQAIKAILIWLIDNTPNDKEGFEKILNNGYFQKNYRFFIPFHENIQPLEKVIQESNYSEGIISFSKFLTNSITLSNLEKYWAAFRYNYTDEVSINNAISVMEIERKHYKDSGLDSHWDLIDLACKDISSWFFLVLKNNRNFDNIYKQVLRSKNSIDDSIITKLADLTQEFDISAFYYSKQKEPIKAIESYKKSTTIKPNNNSSWFNLAREYSRIESNIKAIKCYKKATSIKSDDYMSWHNMGHAYYKVGNYDKAIESYLKTIRIKDNILMTWYNLGVAYGKKENTNRALTCFKTATTIEPMDYKSWFALGETFIILEKNDQAIKFLRKATKINPEFLEAWRKMGELYYNQGKKGKAIECCEKVVSINPNIIEIWSILSQLYNELGNSNNAMKCYKNISRLDPNNLDAWSKMGVIYHKRGKVDKVIECFERSTLIDSNNRDNWFVLAEVYKQQGQKDKAMKCYQNVIRIDPEYVEAWRKMGSIYYEQGKEDKVFDCFRRATTINPKDYQAWFILGDSYSNQGNEIKAISSFKKAIEIKPDFVDAWESYGWSLIKTGDILKSETVLLQAIKLGSEEHVNINLGHVYLVKKQLGKAIKHYRLGSEHFSLKEDFLQTLKEDYESLKQYGIVKKEYFKLIEEIDI